MTVQREGWGALYQGLPCALAQGLVWAGVLLGAEGWLRGATGASVFTPLRFLCACALLGLLEAALLCPLDLLKARLQLKGPRRARAASSGALGALGGLAGGPPGGGPPDTLQRLLVWVEKQASATTRAARELASARGWGGLYMGWPYHVLKETFGAVVCTWNPDRQGGTARNGLSWLLANAPCLLPPFPKFAVCSSGPFPLGFALSTLLSPLLAETKILQGTMCSPSLPTVQALLGVYDVALAMSGQGRGGESSGAAHRAGGRQVHPEGLHWLHLWPTTCLAALAYHLVRLPSTAPRPPLLPHTGPPSHWAAPELMAGTASNVQGEVCWPLPALQPSTDGRLVY